MAFVICEPSLKAEVHKINWMLAPFMSLAEAFWAIDFSKF